MKTDSLLKEDLMRLLDQKLVKDLTLFSEKHENIVFQFNNIL